MHWKRILLVTFPLFSILAVSLFILPRFPKPLRRDPIPSGAYVVPWMRPSPSIEELDKFMPGDPPWDIDVVMANALRLNMTFRIAIPNETRVIRSTVYLGHDMDYLYVGGKFRGMYKNPTSTSDETRTNYFVILFDVANDGKLTFPESGSRFSVALLKDAGWHTGKVWSVHDEIWDYSSDVHREVFVFAEDRRMRVSTVGNSVTLYDNSTGTVIMLFSRHLRKDGFYTDNALQMRPGERWVMGFLLELGFSTHIMIGTDPMNDYVDGWPQKAYPYLNNDSSWWPKLVIDLANPPAEFST